VNMERLIPMMAEELANDILAVSGVKTAYWADEAAPKDSDD
jgi:hypothetical protein